MPFDLHTHSSRSDGTCSPATVAEAAAAAGLTGLALTDHDTVAGWAEARERAETLGLGFVPGVEISCRWEGISVHLLGYLVDPEDAPLFSAIERARVSRTGRAARMVDRLAAAGYPISQESVARHVGEGAAIGRPHIADALVEAGVYARRAEAFDGVLSRHSEFYVPYEAVDPVRAARLVRAAGGVPVLAHPFAARRGEVVGDDVVRAMADAGLGGLEARHRDHTEAQRDHAITMAHELGLLVTGASDYHGAGKPNLIGENTTDDATVQALVRQGSGAAACPPPGGWS